MSRPLAVRLLPAALGALLTLLFAGCGTLDNEIRIAYHDANRSTATLTLRATGTVSDTLLGGELRNQLSRSGWTVRSDDGGDGPAVLTAVYESDNGQPFPSPATTPRGGARVPDLTQTLFRNLEAKADDGTFVRRLRVKFTTPQGAFAMPPVGDPAIQQFMNSLLQAAKLVPAPTGGSGQPNPINEANFDSASFDRMMDSVVKLRVTVSVPGIVKDSNASRTNGGEATWELKADALREQREYFVTGEEVLWGKLGGATASLAFVGGAFGLLGVFLTGGRGGTAPVPVAPPAPFPTEPAAAEAVTLRVISDDEADTAEQSGDTGGRNRLGE